MRYRITTTDEETIVEGMSVFSLRQADASRDEMRVSKSETADGQTPSPMLRTEPWLSWPSELHFLSP
jgi:hypothetical protein